MNEQQLLNFYKEKVEQLLIDNCQLELDLRRTELEKDLLEEQLNLLTIKKK